MITLPDFVKKRIGTQCEHPLGIKGQCVCLIRCYFDEVLALPQFPFIPSAKDLWTTLLADPHFVRITDSLLAIPRAGDIFVMDAWGNDEKSRHGHTGVVLEGSTLSQLRSLDSNWSIPEITTFEMHSYRKPHILGWFRKLNTRTTRERVDEALLACGDDPNRSVGTLTLAKWWQNRVARNRHKFSNDETGYQALVGAIKWHRANHRYPHDN